MSYLLAQDACDAWLRGRPALVARAQQNAGKLHVSALTVLRLEMGVTRYNTPSQVLTRYLSLLQAVRQLSLDDAVAHRGAQLGGHLRRAGQPLPLANLVVAATALVHGLTLVTHDAQAFAAAPGLSTVDWSVP